MEVVAEGIQTADQRARLRGLGCEYGQGFFLSPAVPADEAEQLLMRRVRTVVP
jgi:EAL domain-containing protein (putative c-di-GMP-specific phosphodiesterase class I)